MTYLRKAPYARYGFSLNTVYVALVADKGPSSGTAATHPWVTHWPYPVTKIIKSRLDLQRLANHNQTEAQVPARC